MFIKLYTFFHGNNTKNILYFGVPNHCIKNKIQKYNGVFFFELFDQKQKFEMLLVFSCEIFIYGTFDSILF